MNNTMLYLQPLTQQAFAAFGDVIECQDRAFFPINQGLTERYHALSIAEASGTDAEVAISIFRNLSSAVLPFSINMLERHPYGSQSFIPLNRQKFIIVVALPLDDIRVDENKIYAFISNGLQGVTYRQGVWHHPLISLDSPSDFLVVDRIGQEQNCDVYDLDQHCIIADQTVQPALVSG